MLDRDKYVLRYGMLGLTVLDGNEVPLFRIKHRLFGKKFRFYREGDNTTPLFYGKKVAMKIGLRDWSSTYGIFTGYDQLVGSLKRAVMAMIDMRILDAHNNEIGRFFLKDFYCDITIHGKTVGKLYNSVRTIGKYDYVLDLREADREVDRRVLLMGAFLAVLSDVEAQRRWPMKSVNNGEALWRARG